VKGVLEQLGFENPVRTGEWHMTHLDGRRATFPESPAIAGGTMSAMCRQINITRRQFIEAALKAGVITENRAREILGKAAA
jgi:hypothetical protein